MDRETFVREWAEMAAAKLRVEGVDPKDVTRYGWEREIYHDQKNRNA